MVEFSMQAAAAMQASSTQPPADQASPHHARGGHSSSNGSHTPPLQNEQKHPAMPMVLRKVAPIAECRSYADLQHAAREETIKTAMEKTNLSLGRKSSRQLLDRPNRSKAPARPGSQRPLSAILFNRREFEPIPRTNSAPPTSPFSTPPSSNPNAALGGLPGEIKNQIYRWLFVDSTSTLVLWDNRVINMNAVPGRKAYLKMLPSLAYVNRRTYVEVATWFLEHQTLEIRALADLNYLQDALEHLPGNSGWNSVMSMKFTRFSDLATSPARARELLDFMTRCRNIEQLTLQVKLDLLHMPECDAAYRQLAFLNGTPGIKNPEQVARNYELELLLDLPHLRKLTMICEWHREGPVRCTPRTMATFWDLQDWIAQEFAAKAHNVKEIVKSLPFDDPKQLGAWTVTIKRGKKKDAP